MMFGLLQAFDECELPSCDLVHRSRLHSERCQTTEARWPLLITGTPRSATTFMASLLTSHGGRIQNDWSDPKEDGSVSWIFAFNDANNFGPARTHGLRFENVLHQVREPLKSITSMCTEPLVETGYARFLGRHINYSYAYESPQHKIRAALQFYVEWHKFLEDLRLPLFRVEDIDAETLFLLGGIQEKYIHKARPIKKAVNSRKHRSIFRWNELFTADPFYTRRLWDMATRYGYTFDVKFEDLRCLKTMPSCMGNANLNHESPWCPPGTHPPTTHTPSTSFVEPNTSIEGLVDGGCIETYRQGRWLGTSATRLVRSLN